MDIRLGHKDLATTEERVLSKALTFSSAGKVYCVKTNGPGIALRGARITLLHFQDGTLRVDHKQRSLSYTHFKTNPGPVSAEDDKTLDARLAALVAPNTEQTPQPPETMQGPG